MKQTPNNNKATMNNKATAKQTKKQRKAEADAHRRTNKRWERVETSDRYRKAATEELCNVTGKATRLCPFWPSRIVPFGYNMIDLFGTVANIRGLFL